jgi:hypothetical protein
MRMPSTPTDLVFQARNDHACLDAVRKLLFQVGDDIGSRRAGSEQPTATLFVQLLHVLARNDPAALFGVNVGL